MTERHLDASGFICPLPVLKARKILLSMDAGDILHVRATDPAAAKDFRLFCAEAGHELSSIRESSGGLDITVRKRPLLPPE